MRREIRVFLMFAFFADPQAPFHWPPLALNYLGFLAGLRVLGRFRLAPAALS